MYRLPSAGALGRRPPEMNPSNSLLFQIPPGDVAVRKYLTTHVLLSLKDGTFWRGTLVEWSSADKHLKLRNAQKEGPCMTGLGDPFKRFAFADISDVRVADASDAVLATLTEPQKALVKASAASMARAAAEDARTESHREMTSSDSNGLSVAEMLMQKGIAKPAVPPGSRVRVQGLEKRPDLNGVDGTIRGRAESEGRYEVELADGKLVSLKSVNFVVVPAAAVEDGDNGTDENVTTNKKPRQRGGKKKKKQPTGLIAVDPEVSEQLEAAREQIAAANALSEPCDRAIVEVRSMVVEAVHILPASSVRGAGRVLDLLRAGVGPIIVAPPSENAPHLDDEIMDPSSSHRTTLRALAEKELQAHQDAKTTLRQDLGISRENWDQITNLFARAPPGEENFDADLARILEELEAGSLGVVFK